MNRFWLSWYAFVIHTLMFLMVCGGHVFASDPASSKQSVARVLHDATASFICADHDREGRDDGQLFGETDPTEEVEESEHAERRSRCLPPRHSGSSGSSLLMTSSSSEDALPRARSSRANPSILLTGSQPLAHPEDLPPTSSRDVGRSCFVTSRAAETKQRPEPDERASLASLAK